MLLSQPELKDWDIGLSNMKEPEEVETEPSGFHWSPFPLTHDAVTELVDVGDLALLHLLFEDAE